MERGRPTKYNEDMHDIAKDYIVNHQFKYNHPIPSIEGLAHILGVVAKTLYNWGEAEGNEDFLQTLKDLKQKQKFELFNNGLSGEFNPTITKLMLSHNHGVNETVESVNRNTTVNSEPVTVEEASKAYQEMVKGK